MKSKLLFLPLVYVFILVGIFMYETDPILMFQSDPNVAKYDIALLEAGVAQEDMDCCMRWAFGEDYLSINGQFLSDRWRSLHPELFVIRDTDYAHVALYRVGKAYLNREAEQ